ncbi:MAG TPA: RsmG family class I SAM-dependent methyltransferase [Acidimicrobiales bacterium]
MPDTEPGGLVPPALREVLNEAREFGFLGPGPVETHIQHAEGFVALARRHSPATGDAARILDLGSGGGLPGLVLAVMWPDCSVVLLDAAVRRTGFLREAVIRCGLEARVTVITERAEIAGRDPELRGSFDGVVVRSFGPPAVVAECAAPFLRVGGCVVVSEPPESPDDPTGASIRWESPGLAQVGLETVESVRETYGYEVLRQRELCPDRFPRRNGKPAKSPLF